MEEAFRKGEELRLSVFIWCCIVLLMLAAAQTVADFLHSRWLNKK